MPQFVKIENYTKNGAMGISNRVFETIAEITTNNINGVRVESGSKLKFTLHKPVSCRIMNGKANIEIDVKVKTGFNAGEICEMIQKEVAESLLLMCEIVTFSTNVKIVGFEE